MYSEYRIHTVSSLAHARSQSLSVPHGPSTLVRRILRPLYVECRLCLDRLQLHTDTADQPREVVHWCDTTCCVRAPGHRDGYAHYHSRYRFVQHQPLLLSLCYSASPLPFAPIGRIPGLSLTV